MSRTVADATRFTATSPHAYSKTSSILRSAANTLSPSSKTQPSPPPNAHTPNPRSPQNQPPPQQPETPQQKVARIRALRAAQKLNSLTLWDKTVIRGRRYADIAHRITVGGLIGATGTSSLPSPSILVPFSSPVTSSLPLPQSSHTTNSNLLPSPRRPRNRLLPH